MKVGLIGRQGSGKTTIFNALTGLSAGLGQGEKMESHLGVTKVPDARVDRLSAIFQPKKTTYAEIRFTDFPATQSQEKLKANAALLAQMRDVDAMALVLGDFDGASEPMKDLRDLLAEMILSDLGVVENRISRLKKEKGKEREGEMLARCLKALEGEESLRSLSFTPDEEPLLAGFGFLSRKSVIALFNVAEERAGKELPDLYQAELQKLQIPGLALSARVEMEVAQLDEKDRQSFLTELGIEEPARDRFIRASYRLLDLISFFTTGEDEVKAWTIEQGTSARKAAGKIHSDIERGFIRAEVVAYDDFIRYGSEAKCREAGKLRLEGKDYPVKDGDIVHFRFNV
jgi:GTP-binding protein YchF